MKAWAALLLLLAQDKAGDPSAETVLSNLRTRIEKAQTIRAYTRTTVQTPGRGESSELVSGFTLKGADQWVWDYEWRGAEPAGMPRRTTVVCDGRKMLSDGLRNPELLKEFHPAEVAAELRLSLSLALPSSLAWLHYGQRVVQGPPEIFGIKDLGTERVGDRECRVLEYRIKVVAPQFAGDVPVKLVVDPARNVILRREIVMMGTVYQQVFEIFALDEDLPDSDFRWQSKRRLARVGAAQLLESVKLFMHYTGQRPASLEDLVRRSEALEPGDFWPSRGFLLGGVVPKDPWGRPYEMAVQDGRWVLRCRGADGKPGGKGDDEDTVLEIPTPSHCAVGAPSERLASYFRARVEAALLQSAVLAYRDSYAELPRKKSSLWEPGAGIEVWPEGGWLPGGRVPDDPWGHPYRIISEDLGVRIQIQDPKGVMIGVKGLTAEERQKLEVAALPRISDAERAALMQLFDQLGDDDSGIRDRAHARLKAEGPSILPVLDERLKLERDREIKDRLATLRKGIPVRRPAWMAELSAVRFTVGSQSLGPGDRFGNERRASTSLKTLTTAQADFRANDRDSNRVNDFWTGDVAGLYTTIPKGGTEMIKLIEVEVALADAAPLDEEGLTALGERQPFAGYWFRVLTKDNSEAGDEADYQKATMAGAAKTHNTSKFGLVAYPAEYGVSGTYSYIINENNTIFRKDMQGETLLEWPDDNGLREWSKID